MSKTARNILFIVFVSFFFTAAPILVLYTAGISYNVKSGNVIKTGVLSITTTPRNANIFVDEIDTEHDTPYVVKNLTAGNFSVKLTKEGYHNWNGNIEVKESETIFLQNLLLFKNSTPKILMHYDIELSAINPNGEIFAYTFSNNNKQELRFYNVETWDETLNESFDNSLSVITDLKWSAGGRYLLVSFNNTDPIIYNANGDVIEIEALLKYQNPSWHPSADNILYLTSSKGLVQVDLETRTTKTFTDVSANTVSLDASLLTFVDNGSQIELRQNVGDESNLIALLPRSEYTILLRDGPYIMLGDAGDELFVVNIRSQEPLLLESNATMFDWLSEQQLLVYSDGIEINVYDPKTHTVEFITRQGEQITGLKWHPTGNAILASTQNTISAIETFKSAEERMTTELLNDDNIENFWISKNGQQLYYLRNGTVLSLELTR